ncbi:MAG: SDR family NAD(P)-dependent oxidoreductase [Candidatus Marinimicrobia bacterium]|jgi:short-subunit dehydrogenase|nr:SDR family NAD(P)-dependent oxidoreductase [Candidatus Neomarinimicrobiota bacterium]MBT3936356.1 SDR family NAD(P)-dependent oxidoreductase [Candidatus Neomarinimicrobiota bacterium]MBT3960308.1 SDR family NAD(P)-dependent oxidoreductase [Candidatus Neomarinimicrobiota bacterium]MBT4383396.1 SDR family NAD(P)-dependent oxidoreductase [Candidatus Neomarinimicrobiota bacterium]MBT4635409.1 SDR family NAD(P)-dependent oxidoreductase [Candidatus Neomarinimicrobiota bacterium]
MNIFITGASSGIGESLAYYYAQKGATIGLVARREDRLKAVVEKVKELGGNPISYILDVANQEDVQKATSSFLEQAERIDMVIANAGVGGSDNLSSGNASTINKILSINILGVTNTVIPFIPSMKEQKSGQICIISSIAGTRGLIGHGGYSGSKAAVRLLGDSWDYSLSRHNISTTVVSPGWIATEMTARHTFKMLFLMDSETAAGKIANAIEKRKRKYILPWQWNIIVPIFRFLPRWMIKLVSV